MIRCTWMMPENGVIEAGARCLKYADHGKVHVIAAHSGSSVTFWQINPRKRTVRPIIHADLRDSTILDDEECVALYHSLKQMKRAA
jgi:hypothetical protein